MCLNNREIIVIRIKYTMKNTYYFHRGKENMLRLFKDYKPTLREVISNEISSLQSLNFLQVCKDLLSRNSLYYYLYTPKGRKSLFLYLDNYVYSYVTNRVRHIWNCPTHSQTRDLLKRRESVACMWGSSAPCCSCSSFRRIIGPFCGLYVSRLRE